MLDLSIEPVQDPEARENFRRILEFSTLNPLFASNWRVFEVTFDTQVSNLKFPHGLNYQPKDVIITSTTGPGVLSFSYASFDRTNLVLSTTNSCTARFLVGTLGAS